MRYKQEDYYDIELIKQRLSSSLGSDRWNNLKRTDLGQSIIALCSNTVHMDAMAFFTGLDQMYKSTVTMPGYLEEIAKSKGVIPKTYISANLTLSLYAKNSVRSFLPLDFSLRVDGRNFYAIADVSIGMSNNPATLVLYEGSVIREASEAGRPVGSSWTYAQYKAVQAEKVGDRIVRKYIVLPREVYVDSIIVETSVGWDVPFVRWNRVGGWFNVGQTERSWKLGKDYLGRYTIEFGDGVYGREYPSDEIVGVQYILSNGEGVTIESYANAKLYSQDVNDVTNDFVIGGISNLVDGLSEVNMSDLGLEIESAENTKSSVISELDHRNYLESRSDVLYASVKAERHVNPPNVDYFNVMSYALKPNADGGSFNNSDIQNYLGKYGLKTVDYRNVVVKREKFNIKVGFSALAGYTASGVQSQLNSVLGVAFNWSNLGFEETISEERIYALIKDIEGLDLTTLSIAVEFVYTDETNGGTSFTWNINDVVQFRFYPRRFRMYVDSEVLVSGTVARDNGKGYLYGDVADRERFNYSSGVVAANSFNFGGLMLLGNGSSDTSYLLDLRKSAGAVSKLKFLDTVLASCWCSRYSELITVEYNVSYKINSYSFPVGFFDQTGFNYIQLSDVYEWAAAKKTLTVTPPANTDGVGAVVYFDSYVYIVWHLSTGNHRLCRYRITSTAIDTVDTTYNATGYLELSLKDCRSIAVVEDAFNNGKNVMFITTDTNGTTECGIDAVIDFDNADDCIFELDFFNATLSLAYTAPFPLWGISTDGSSLFLTIAPTETTSKTVIIKLYSLNANGTCTVKVLTDNSVDGLQCAVYSIYNAVAEVFAYSVTTYNLYKVGFDALNAAPTKRAGDGTGNLTSIAKIATIDYDLQQMTFDIGITGTLRYESENDLVFENEEMIILNTLTIYQK